MQAVESSQSAVATSDVPTAVELESRLTLVKQDLSDVRVGPNFSEDLPEKEDLIEDNDLDKDNDLLPDHEEVTEDEEQDGELEVLSNIATNPGLSQIQPSDQVEKKDRDKQAVHEGKIRKMKKFLSGTLKRRFDTVTSVRDTIENPTQAKTAVQKKKKKTKATAKGGKITNYRHCGTHWQKNSTI